MIFDPKAILYEYVPTRLKERMIVQIGSGTTFVGTLWSFRKMLFSRKYGLFGLVVLPSHFLMLIVFTWVLMVAVVAIVLESLFALLEGLVALTLIGIGLLVKWSRISTNLIHSLTDSSRHCKFDVAVQTAYPDH